MTDSAMKSDELAEFRTSFFEECGELLVTIDSLLSDLDEAPLDADAVNEVFRAVHTIKGSAGFFDLTPIVNFAHTFETLLSAIRENRLSQSAHARRLLVQGADALSAIFEASREERTLAEGYGSDLVREMEHLLEETDAHDTASAVQPETRSPTNAAPAPTRTLELRFSLSPDDGGRLPRHEPVLAELARMGELETVQSGDGHKGKFICRLKTSQDEHAIRQAFAFVEHELELSTPDDRPAAASVVAAPARAEKPERPGPETSAAPQRDTEREAPAPVEGGRSSSRAAMTTIRVELARVDRLVNMVGELVITQAMLAQQVADQRSNSRPQIRQGHEDLANYTRELQECVMAIRMQPVKSVFSRMPRLVRDMSVKLGKRVRLVTSGEQTEVDKTVIEELADPLLHMIRNAIDHGIESAEQRRAAGKPEEGTIELSASQRGGNILITVSDDGAGIDRQKLRNKAVERGVISAEAGLSGEEIDQLIFAPGFSTAETVTDVSGRGVGMDVVRSNIGNLGGRIQIQSVLGRGTKFTLILPLTLAVLDGMMIAVSSETYILPLTNIVETIRPDKRTVRQLANGSTVVAIRGEFIRLVNLGELFGLRAAALEPWKALVIVVELDNGAKLGIVVDELIGQRQVVVKSLQENFDPVPGVSGATILGTGRVALILDIEQLSRLTSRSPPLDCAAMSESLDLLATDQSPASSTSPRAA